MIRVALLVAVAMLAIGSPVVARTAPPTPTHRAGSSHPPNALPKPGDRDCLRSTGSLISPRPGQCLPVAGRSYSQQELRRTGATTTTGALRMLDAGIH